MALHGENPFASIGDPSYEWVKPEPKTREIGPWRYGSWENDWMLLDTDELTLEVVTNPTVRELFDKAQRTLGYRDPNSSPEAIKAALLEQMKFYDVVQEGSAIEAKTLAWTVFGVRDPRDPNFDWVASYLDGLSEMRQGIEAVGEGQYQALPESDQSALISNVNKDLPALSKREIKAAIANLPRCRHYKNRRH